MKLTEGMLQHTFEDFAPRYPQIEAKHILIDNAAHQLAMRPEQFDVIVTTNMNGDILSDLTSGLTGGLGFAPSANIGSEVSIFEAVHGSAPDIAGKNIANPTALVLSAAMMLRHIGEGAAAHNIEQAVLVTLESGVRSGDMAGTAKPSSTTDFADAIISNLGKSSTTTGAKDFRAVRIPEPSTEVEVVEVKTRRVTGLDVFIESKMLPEELGADLTEITGTTPFALQMIANRGNTVWPVEDGRRVTLIDQYRCRFLAKNRTDSVANAEILSLLTKIGEAHTWMHVEKLQHFDGEDAFSRTQR
jgi:isocitrate dehydrogenase